MLLLRDPPQGRCKRCVHGAANLDSFTNGLMGRNVYGNGPDEAMGGLFATKPYIAAPTTSFKWATSNAALVRDLGCLYWRFH